MKNLRTSLSILVCAGVLIAAGVIGFILMKTAPRTEPVDKAPAAKVVQVIELQPRTEPISITAFGPVMASREVAIKPQVGGRIVQHSPGLALGGRIAKGEEVAVIDPADYQLTLAQRQAEYEEAKFEFELERGRQTVAEREWEELRGDLPEAEVNRDLVLRKPHQKKTEAMLEKASNAIERAELDLKRTSVTAPFNGVVTEESVEMGQLVNAGEEICKLVGSDEFWVRATLPISDLQWVTFPEPGSETGGSKVRVKSDQGSITAEWEGEVIRLLGDLDPNGRMARVLIRVPDPLGLETEEENFIPLLLGNYVRAEIEAGTLENVLAIPRTALRQDDRIWVVNGDNEMQIRDTKILWTHNETILVSNVIEDGEHLIVSSLRSALPGMKVEPVLIGGGESETLAETDKP